MKVFIPESTLQNLINRYQAGESMISLSCDFGCSADTLKKNFKGAGVTIHQRPIISDDSKAEIILFFNQGMSATAIAKQLHHGKDGVIEILKEHGYTPMLNRFTPEMESEIVKCYNSGEKVQDIAIRLGCKTHHTVNNVLKRNGVKLRHWGGVFRRLNEKEITQLRKRYRSGEKVNSLAQSYGLSECAFRQWLRQLGETVKRGSKYGKRESHHNWKGGRSVDKQGYVKICADETDPFFCMSNVSGYILEHRYVMAQKLNRPLLATETVHHIDGNKLNNHPDNLELRQGKHSKGIVYQCCDCGSHNVIESGLAG